MSDFVWAPRCSHYTGRERCTALSVVWIHAPGSPLPVPGCWVCREHGEAVITEYREKLGEEWTLQPLRLLETHA